MKCVLNKYVVENTMGDNKYFINVKFVYNYYLFGKLVKSETKIDPIVFSKKDDAERYAKYVVKPSKKINGVYFKKHITNINNDGVIFKVFTEIDDELIKASLHLANIDKSSINKEYEVFYIIGDDYHVHYDYRNAPTFALVRFQDFVITNKTQEEQSIYLGDDNVCHDKDLKEAYKQFKDYVENRIKVVLESERKERLSKTLIDSTETLVKDETMLDKSSIDSSINVPFDEARNELIKQELKRVNEYKNFLTKLLK